MIKLFELWTRRPDMTHEAVRHWTEVHAPLVKKTFGDKIIKYVTNVGLPLDTRGWSRNEAPPYDGIAEFWIDMTVEELGQAIRETAHILWPDEQINNHLAFYPDRVDEVCVRGSEVVGTVH